MQKTRLEQIDEEQEVVGRELHELYKLAGVMDQVQRLERSIEPDYFRDKAELTAPMFTDLWKKQKRAQDDADDAMRRLGTRDIVFGIPDLELRSKVIAKERRAWALKLNWFSESAREPRERLQKLQSSNWQGLSLGNVLVPMVIVGLIAYFYEVKFAFIAAALAIVFIFSSALMGQKLIQSVQAEVASAESFLNDVEREPEPFSYHEELNGEPDDPENFLGAQSPA